MVSLKHLASKYLRDNTVPTYPTMERELQVLQHVMEVQAAERQMSVLVLVSSYPVVSYDELKEKIVSKPKYLRAKKPLMPRLVMRSWRHWGLKRRSVGGDK